MFKMVTCEVMINTNMFETFMKDLIVENLNRILIIKIHGVGLEIGTTIS